MPDEFRFTDPDGTFLVLPRQDAEALARRLRAEDEDEPLSEALTSLLVQLEEWLA